jgi:hypothetical protein
MVVFLWLRLTTTGVLLTSFVLYAVGLQVVGHSDGGTYREFRRSTFRPRKLTKNIFSPFLHFTPQEAPFCKVNLCGKPGITSDPLTLENLIADPKSVF